MEKIKSTVKTLDEAQAKIDAARAQQVAAQAELERQRMEIAAHQAPIIPLLQEHEQLTATASRVKASQGVYRSRIAELRDAVDRELAKEHGCSSLLHNVYELSTYLPHVHAERALLETERFLTENAVKLATLEKEISAVVKERDLAHLLPQHLKNLA